MPSYVFHINFFLSPQPFPFTNFSEFLMQVDQNVYHPSIQVVIYFWISLSHIRGMDSWAL